MENKELAVAVSSTHLKGGCGKTTLLTDLGIYLATHGENVVAVDTDMQGSMFSTLTGIPPQRYSPKERRRYLEDLKRGNSIEEAKTEYSDVNSRLIVCHYPIQMFANDSFHQSEFVSGFGEVLGGIFNQADAILVDLPPAKLEGGDAVPFKQIDRYVRRFYFLIPSRPTDKEIEDGLFCYSSLSQLLEEEGIGADRLSKFLVLNHHQIESVRKNWDGRVVERIMISSSPFSPLDKKLKGKGMEPIIVPTVPRQGQDMNHYSILLDSGFDWKRVNARPADSKISQMTDTDFCLSFGESVFDDIEAPNPALVSQREYVEALRRIAECLK